MLGLAVTVIVATIGTSAEGEVGSTNSVNGVRIENRSRYEVSVYCYSVAQQAQYDRYIKQGTHSLGYLEPSKSITITNCSTVASEQSVVSLVVTKYWWPQKSCLVQHEVVAVSTKKVTVGTTQPQATVILKNEDLDVK